MNSDWFSGIEILQSRWQHGEKVGYCYPSGPEKTLCKWGIYVILTKSLFKSAGIIVSHFFSMLPSTLKYLYSIEPVRMHFPAKQPVYK
jgi:hypothetical protein